MYDVKIVKVVTMGTHKKQKNLEITYGFYETRFGKCVIGLYEDSLCFLSFKTEQTIWDPIQYMKRCLPNATFIEHQNVITKFAMRLFDDEKEKNVAVAVTLFGTEFQVKVWKALLEIKEGSTASYEDVAVAIGYPRAIRATANAVANNKIAYIVPCHRVIRKNGNYVGKYRWGVERKTKMLEYEGVYLV